MRAADLLTLLSSLAALACSFMVLFAGYTTSTLPALDLFKINVAQIANTQFNNGTGNGCNCVEFVNGTLTINGTAVVNGTLSLGTATLDISQFYSVFAINYCEGTFLPNSTAPGASAVLTHCETPSLGRHFNLVTIIENALQAVGVALGENLSLADLDWPNGITSSFVYVQSAGPAYTGFSLVGLASLIMATAAAFWSLFRGTRRTAIFLFITSVISSLALTIGAGIATAIIAIVTNGINANGEELGISAKSGSTFMAMQWSSVALLFISTLTTTASFCVGSDRGSSRGSSRGLYRGFSQRFSQRSSRGSHAPLSQYEGYDMPFSGRRKAVPYAMYPPDSAYDPWSSRRTLVNDPYNEYGDEFR